MSIIETTKELIDLAKKGATIELELRLVRMQEQELELREEIVRLKSKLIEIEEDRALAESLEMQDGVYVKDGRLVCQMCWDSERKIIHLQKHVVENFDEFSRPLPATTYFNCLKCKSNYGG
jgi:hypothetical protein